MYLLKEIDILQNLHEFFLIFSVILEENKVAFYEIFDNYLVFYWREFKASETKTIRLDLKADIAGHYQAPASTVYLYYGDENKTWISGNTVEIKDQ